MNKKPSEPKGEFPWDLVVAGCLLFFTALVFSLVIFLLYHEVSLSDDWQFNICAVVIAWIAFFMKDKEPPAALNRVAAATIPFIRSGERKGFTFEVLMNFLSSITIVLLIATISSVLFQQESLLFHIVGWVVWLIAILLATMTAGNFSHHVIAPKTKGKVVNIMILINQALVLGIVFLLFYLDV